MTEPTMTAPRQLYVAWTQFQRRQLSLAPHFGFETVFYPVQRRIGKIRKFSVYLRNGWRTFRELQRQRPPIVWVQLPQVPLLWVALAYRALVDRKVRIVADCHNAMFRRPWCDVPYSIGALNRADVVLAHNEDVAETARRLGVQAERLMVMEDPPATLRATGGFVGADDMPRPWFVFPASFAADEPIRELIEAARQVPEVSVLVTGNSANCQSPELFANLPANFRLLGYLTVEAFEDLIVRCDAVIALTKFDGIQLSVCGEALGAGKPMLISDTPTLRRLFPEGTLFVRSDDGSALAEGMSDMRADLSRLTCNARAFNTRWREQWGKTRGVSVASKMGCDFVREFE